MKIMQGDSYPIPVEITQDGVIVTPEMVAEVEITVGKTVRKTYTSGGVFFTENMWYFLLTQEETFSLSGGYGVVVRLKYPQVNNVVGKTAGVLTIQEIDNGEVL